MEWLLAAVMGYALMLLLVGLYIVIRGLPAGWFGSGSAKESGRPLGVGDAPDRRSFSFYPRLG